MSDLICPSCGRDVSNAEGNVTLSIRDSGVTITCHHCGAELGIKQAGSAAGESKSSAAGWLIFLGVVAAGVLLFFVLNTLGLFTQ